MNGQAAVIGAGIGGLAVAVRLKNLGFDVQVFESRDHPGGKIDQFHRDGFRFDKGATLFTLPSLVTELFTQCHQEPSDYLSYHALSETTRYFFEDGTQIKAYGTADQFADELDRRTSDSAETISRYLENASDIYELTSRDFLFSSFDWSNLLSPSFWRAAAQLHKLHVGRTLHQVNQSYFDDPKTIQLFDRYATYMGSDPYRAPGTLAVIPHLEHNLGAFFPEGGMYQIIEAMHQLALDIGISFRFSEPVERLEVNNGSVNAVLTDRDAYTADVVVGNVDVSTLYDRLMPELVTPKQSSPEAPSSSALVFYWGVEGTYPSLDMHNILFSDDYREEFDSLFRRNTIAADPTVYVYISCKSVPDDAPEGHENWYVMVNAPPDDGQDWPSLITKTREAILRKISRVLSIDVRDKVLFEERWDPRRIAAQTGSWKGSLYGQSFNSKWAAFRRHPNRARTLDNLYLAGGSVHPGGGIPLCLASARIVESLIKSDWS